MDNIVEKKLISVCVYGGHNSIWILYSNDQDVATVRVWSGSVGRDQ